MRSIALGLLVLGCLLGSVRAQDYPTKPLKVIVPFAPGSAADYSTRFHAEKLSQIIGQPVVVDNRPGANSVIGFMAVKDAPADGYTLLAASNSPMTVNPWTLKNLPYDAVKDFRPIAGLFRGQAAFVVPGSSKFRTLQELIAAGKAGELNVGTYAAGYTLFAHLFASESGIKIAIIPYKGLGQVLTDIAGGRLDLAIVDSGGTLPFVRDGRARALAVSGEGRNSELPGVPTVRESGFPNYSAYTWLAFYIRADVPDAYVNKLAAAMQKVLETKEAKEFVLKHGGEQMPLGPEGMVKFHHAEYERMGRVARAAGIKPE
jgi:tripartite-type tricarboxylate transporter receptor subunit TctC